jgi:tRNA(His) 5'-end guanylyltransferase
MTSEEEKIVKGLKKKRSDFAKRYDKDAQSVMYATAKKLAKNK